MRISAPNTAEDNGAEESSPRMEREQVIPRKEIQLGITHV
jgi:hypothetical protein